MKDLVTHLHDAINRYSLIREYLEKIQAEVGTASAGNLQKMGEDLTALQENACQCEQIIGQYLARKQEWPSHIQSLIDQRELLLQEVRQLHSRVTAKAQDLRSLISHDLQRISKSHAALSGYRLNQAHQGQIVNNIS